jgi:hypothetical protein
MSVIPKKYFFGAKGFTTIDITIDLFHGYQSIGGRFIKRV